MEELKKVCYVVTENDNVATAMADIECGMVELTGDVPENRFSLKAVQLVPFGHKIALKKINTGEAIVKYGAPIGIAVEDIEPGTHVHMHNMKSAYDFRSAQLDPQTAHAKDIEYKTY